MVKGGASEKRKHSNAPHTTTSPLQELSVTLFLPLAHITQQPPIPLTTNTTHSLWRAPAHSLAVDEQLQSVWQQQPPTAGPPLVREVPGCQHRQQGGQQHAGPVVGNTGGQLCVCWECVWGGGEL